MHCLLLQGYTPLDNLRDQHTRNVEDMTRDEVLAVRRMEHSMQNIMKGQLYAVKCARS